MVLLVLSDGPAFLTRSVAPTFCRCPRSRSTLIGRAMMNVVASLGSALFGIRHERVQFDLQ